MYTQNSTLKRPTNSRQELWRYVPLDRLLNLLQTGELFFTHLPAFSDGLEGALTARSRTHLANWFQAHNGSDELSALLEVECYEKNQAEFYANCWHMNNSESYLMWKAYASRGYALRTTFERVQASFDLFEGSISGGVVDYVDFQRDLTPVGNVFNHVATKDLPYRDEREFRLVLWTLDNKNCNLTKQENGIRVPVDLQMLIERVVVSPFTRSIAPQLERHLAELNIPIESSSVSYRGKLDGAYV